MRRRCSRPLLFSVALLMALSGCGQADQDAERGEAATCTVDPERPPVPTETTVTALVSRVECAGGVTGSVLAPVVEENEQRVVVTYSVERTPDGDATCPGNIPVQQTLSLKNPPGDRPLFDGGCPTAPEATGCEPRQVWPA